MALNCSPKVSDMSKEYYLSSFSSQITRDLGQVNSEMHFPRHNFPDSGAGWSQSTLLGRAFHKGNPRMVWPQKARVSLSLWLPSPLATAGRQWWTNSLGLQTYDWAGESPPTPPWGWPGSASSTKGHRLDIHLSGHHALQVAQGHSQCHHCTLSWL